MSTLYPLIFISEVDFWRQPNDGVSSATMLKPLPRMYTGCIPFESLSIHCGIFSYFITSFHVICSTPVIPKSYKSFSHLVENEIASYTETFVVTDVETLQLRPPSWSEHRGSSLMSTWIFLFLSFFKVAVSNMFLFAPLHWGNDPIWLCSSLQMGWNHHLVFFLRF